MIFIKIFLSFLIDWIVFFLLRDTFQFYFLITIILLLNYIKINFINLTKINKVFVFIAFPLSYIILNYQINNLYYLAIFLLLILIYPPTSWNDAPIYPTQKGNLENLDKHIDFIPEKVLDLGAGMGHAMTNLSILFPKSKIYGVENSFLIFIYIYFKFLLNKNIVATYNNMWNINFYDYDIIYCFQRPENMTLIWDKFNKESKKNSLLISLEFEVPNIKPTKLIKNNKNIYIYQK